jgi:hypothetical protein
MMRKADAPLIRIYKDRTPERAQEEAEAFVRNATALYVPPLSDETVSKVARKVLRALAPSKEGDGE